MIGLIIYLIGIIIAGIWVYQIVICQYLQVTLNDALLFTSFCLFSWVTVIILVLVWFNDHGDEIILWRKE